jgi:glycosyltransferase involved in cell wall biosynthesis
METEPGHANAVPLSPLISVVTVSLNAATTIEDTLASVYMQRLGFPIEHICVDGGSTDLTRRIIDGWAARSGQIRRLYEPDQGIFDAMNKGLLAAAGEYVLFLNADDFLVGPGVLASATKGLVPGAPDNPDLIVGDVVLGRLGCRGVWRRRRVPRSLQRLRGLGLFPVHQGMLTRRRLLQGAGGFNADQRLAADTNLYYDLERHFRLNMRFTRADIAFMRAGGSANAGLSAMWRGTAEIYRHLLRSYGPLRSTGMVLVKTLQSLAELRYGKCPHERWFAHALPRDYERQNRKSA